MGGSLSKLDENDWHQADGKLGSADTVDGKNPVDSYTIFYLTKRSLNQREFDVVDSECNLIFTTRPVPGTLACFDLMGRGMNEFILRVTVDVARRHWIISRVGVPTFEGQEVHREATSKLAAELVETQTISSSEEIPKLYKRCCITLSWSRYMMVAAHYGPPSVHMLMENAAQQHSDRLGFASAANNDSRDLEPAICTQENTSATKEEVDGDEACSGSSGTDLADLLTQVQEENTDLPAAECIDEKTDKNSTEELASSAQESVGLLPGATFASMTNIRKWLQSSTSHMAGTNGDSTAGTEKPSTDETLLPKEHPPSTERDADNRASVNTMSTLSLRKWAANKSGTFRRRFNSGITDKGGEDLQEGVVDLNKPLLLCQEIYNRVFGNFQTSRVSRDEVLIWLKIDREQHMKDHPDETEIDPEYEQFDTAQEANAVPSPGSGVEECKDEEQSSEPSSTVSETGSQPLVGYWRWEHTMKTHRMELRLAKGTDLGTHGKFGYPYLFTISHLFCFQLCMLSWQ